MGPPLFSHAILPSQILSHPPILYPVHRSTPRSARTTRRRPKWEPIFLLALSYPLLLCPTSFVLACILSITYFFLSYLPLNSQVREDDEEMFEMNPVEYIRRDSEGSDADTRRRTAADLLRALADKYEGQVRGREGLVF